jgi:hypothetical protein
VASIILIVVLSLFVAVVSLPYLLLGILWIGLSAVATVFRVRRSARKANYQSGVDQFSYELSVWLRNSALPVVVALAFVTLVLAPPALGSTAILIAAIFGRRLLLALADVLPDVATRGVSSLSKSAPQLTQSVVRHLPTGSVSQKPIDFLASAVGRNQVSKELRLQGVDFEHFRLINPNSPSPSILSSFANGDQLLIRVFSPKAISDRDQEFNLRQSQFGNLFPISASEQLGEFVGFPAVFVRLESFGSLVDFNSEVQRESVANFQVRREIESLTKLEGEHVPLGVQPDHLLHQLWKLARIPGDHVDESIALTRRLDEIFELLFSLKTTLVPSTPLSADHFYSTHNGNICYLGGVTWTRGHMGDQWVAVELFESQLHQAVQESTLNLDSCVNEIMLNAELNELSRLISGLDLRRIAISLRRVNARLDSLTGKEET